MIMRVARRIRTTITLFRHRGTRYFCPFCSYSARDLAPLGWNFPVLREKQVIGSGLRNAICHKCGSTDRERLILAYLRDNTPVLNNAARLKVLHLAPEGSLSALLLKAGFAEYVCGDLCVDGYRYPDHVRNMNVLDIPFPDCYFDLVICNHVLEHVPDDLAAMRSIYRVLKPSGEAILQVPISANSAESIEDPSIIDPRQREFTFGQFDHVRLYGQDYLARLASCGFDVRVARISAGYPTWGLNPSEDVFVAGRRGN